MGRDALIGIVEDLLESLDGVFVVFTGEISLIRSEEGENRSNIRTWTSGKSVEHQTKL